MHLPWLGLLQYVHCVPIPLLCITVLLSTYSPTTTTCRTMNMRPASKENPEANRAKKVCELARGFQIDNYLFENSINFANLKGKV